MKNIQDKNTSRRVRNGSNCSDCSWDNPWKIIRNANMYKEHLHYLKHYCYMKNKIQIEHPTWRDLFYLEFRCVLIYKPTDDFTLKNKMKLSLGLIR